MTQMPRHFIPTSQPGNHMQQISVARLYEDNKDKLGLTWTNGQRGGDVFVRRDTSDAPALVGHLNLIHPNRIQVLGTV